MMATTCGAADFIEKGQVDATLLDRSIRQSGPEKQPSELPLNLRHWG